MAAAEAEAEVDGVAVGEEGVEGAVVVIKPEGKEGGEVEEGGIKEEGKVVVVAEGEGEVVEEEEAVEGEVVGEGSSRRNCRKEKSILQNMITYLPTTFHRIFFFLIIIYKKNTLTHIFIERSLANIQQNKKVIKIFHTILERRQNNI